MNLSSIKRRLLLTAVAGAVFAGALGAMSLDRGPAPAVAAPGDPVDGAIARAKARIADDPGHARANASLAAAALVKARVTADPAWYQVAGAAARRALATDPRNPEALDALGTLNLARHRFAAALPYANRSRRAAPARLAPYEIQIDALIELGRYREGFRVAEQRLALRPDLASYSRASYAAELQGRHGLATRLMSLAADAGRPGGEEAAWSRVELANLRFRGGDASGAERELARVLAQRPDDGRALAGLANVRAAQGRLAESERLLTRALELQATSAIAARLAEVQDALGKVAERNASLDAAREIDRVEARNGVLLALDVAGFEADWTRPDARAVARARRAHAQRPGVIGDEVLGWVLTRSGRCREGLTFATRSLRLGTRDPLMRFRAGMAAACAGEERRARRYLREALALNPAFSVRWAPVARRTLERLG